METLLIGARALFMFALKMRTAVTFATSENDGLTGGSELATAKITQDFLCLFTIHWELSGLRNF